VRTCVWTLRDRTKAGGLGEGNGKKRRAESFGLPIKALITKLTWKGRGKEKRMPGGKQIDKPFFRWRSGKGV